jgi:hypothetical protein
MHHRNRSIALAVTYALGLIAGSLMVGLALRPDNAEAKFVPAQEAPVVSPLPVEIDIIDEPGPPDVITIHEVLIVSHRKPVFPAKRVGTTIRDPKAVPEMVCGKWNDSLVGGQYKDCVLQ